MVFSIFFRNAEITVEFSPFRPMYWSISEVPVQILILIKHYISSEMVNMTKISANIFQFLGDPNFYFVQNFNLSYYKGM